MRPPTFHATGSDLCSTATAANELTAVDLSNFNDKTTWGWFDCGDLQLGLKVCLSTGTPFDLCGAVVYHRHQVGAAGLNGALLMLAHSQLNTHAFPRFKGVLFSQSSRAPFHRFPSSYVEGPEFVSW